MRQTIITLLTVAGLFASVAPASAQFGVGGRFAWVNPDTEVDEVDKVRFAGGQVRFLAGRIGIEVAIDRHSETIEALNQKVTETPIQASLMLRSGGRFAPYLLGGPGWYRRSVEPLDADGDDDGDLELSTTEFGWHAGIGLEIMPSRHFGIHGDYRYTFLDFNGDDDDDDDDDDGGGFFGKLFPGHRGSMWTLGATIYF